MKQTNEIKQVLSLLVHVIDELNKINDKVTNINKKLSTGKGGKPRRNLVGEKFGKLTILSRAPDRKVGKRVRTAWLCECECGKRKEVLTSNLSTKNTSSCGCGRRKIITKHGHSKRNIKSPTYVTWNCMKTRCQCESHKMYYHYGARGITVCDRWQSFPNFLEDMGERPSTEHQIHRLDREKGYEPDNCIWVHQSEHKGLENE